MLRKDVVGKMLAVTGAALVWFPVLAPLVLSLVRSFSMDVFRLDYLMPAELFPLALVGGGLLLWAALRTGIYGKLVGWALGIAAGSLVAGQVVAALTGLASGAVGPGGWQWVLVLATLALYTLMLLVMGITGLLLLRDLFTRDIG